MTTTIPILVDFVIPRHECGMCDGPLTYVSTFDNHYWFKCDACCSSHTSQDCCDHPNVKNGDRIMLTHMEDDPDPIAVGETGTVRYVGEAVGQVQVDWDNGRTLLLLREDRFEVLYTIVEEGLIF